MAGSVQDGPVTSTRDLIDAGSAGILRRTDYLEAWMAQTVQDLNKKFYEALVLDCGGSDLGDDDTSDNSFVQIAEVQRQAQRLAMRVDSIGVHRQQIEDSSTGVASARGPSGPQPPSFPTPSGARARPVAQHVKATLKSAGTKRRHQFWSGALDEGAVPTPPPCSFWRGDPEAKSAAELAARRQRRSEGSAPQEPSRQDVMRVKTKAKAKAAAAPPTHLSLGRRGVCGRSMLSRFCVVLQRTSRIARSRRLWFC